MSGLFGIFCSLLLLSALEFTPSESLPHRQTRQIPDINKGMDAFKNMTGSIPGADMFTKVPEMAKEFVKKAQEMGDQFMKPRSRRDTQSQELNLHRVARQIPGFDQAISSMKSAGESFIQTGSDIISKVPEVAGEFMNKTQQMMSQFMNPSGRRRRSPKPKSLRSNRHGEMMITVEPR